jgi:cell division transport system permease protein
MEGSMARSTQQSNNRGASTHSLGVTDKVKSVGVHHLETCVKTLRELLSTWLASLMTWMLIGIALALPAFLHVLLTNTMALGQNFDGTAKINIYLVRSADHASLIQQLEDDPAVDELRLITAEAALVDFQQDSGFSNILNSLPANPLPDVVELKPTDSAPVALELLTSKLEAREEVERVAVDLEWLNRLQAVLALGDRFVSTLALFLCIGVALAIGNTIRLAIENRRAEIEIVKLVGATDAFVRRPFLYLGFWYGFGGALIAWLLVQISFLVLSGPIERLLVSYQNQFALEGVGFMATLLMFIAGSLLGVAGAAISVSRHLHTIEPK